MARKRPRGLLSIFGASIACAVSGRREHVPTSAEYPDTLIRRIRVSGYSAEVGTCSRRPDTAQAMLAPKIDKSPRGRLRANSFASWAREIGPWSQRR